MGGIFGKKSSKSSKQPAITEQDRAILVKINSFLIGKYELFFISSN